MSNYLIIQEYDESKAYAFKVILEGYRPVRSRLQREQYTTSGSLDVQIGVSAMSWHYTIKLYGSITGSFSVSADTIMTETTAYWGDIDDLTALFNESTPPDNKYRFRDLDGEEYWIVFTGNMMSKSMTPEISGANAYFLVQVSLKEAT